MFVVNGIGQLRRSMAKKTWLAFLDLRKAFPNIWYKGLWTKMKGYCLGGKTVRVLETIYANTHARVRIGALFRITSKFRRG